MTPKRMSPARLAVKRAHAARRPDGRTAELVAHIDAVETEAHDLIENLIELDWLWHKRFNEEGRQVYTCAFCNGEGTDKTFRHDDDCIIKRARKFLEETTPND